MTLQQRINLLLKLGSYMQNNDQQWQEVKEKAYRINPWFIPEFINYSEKNIIYQFLQEDKLLKWLSCYQVPLENPSPVTVGIVMAGNIPLVGFHDFLCIFITGHRQLIKLSSKDNVLLSFLVSKMHEWEPETIELIKIAENLKGCDAYITTGGNNTSRYFEYYFGKFPHIIRCNRTSVAILNGQESGEELKKLADDMMLFFGMGCRNVTKLYVPYGYDFTSLLEAHDRYEYYTDFHKYKHNYDYQLALLMMGKKFYMTNGVVLLTENPSLFTATSVVHYEYYPTFENLQQGLVGNDAIQCIVAHRHVPFGKAQQPELDDYADGVDTMNFALTLRS